jgi:hypothetical protein
MLDIFGKKDFEVENKIQIHSTGSFDFTAKYSLKKVIFQMFTYFCSLRPI